MFLSNLGCVDLLYAYKLTCLIYKFWHELCKSDNIEISISNLCGLQFTLHSLCQDPAFPGGAKPTYAPFAAM